MSEVRVTLPTGGYFIHIAPGIVAQIGELLVRANLTGRTLIVSDTNVADQYGARVLGYFKQAGIDADLFAIPPGEESKTLTTAMDVYTKAITMGLDRHSPIIAMGGGVVGDLAGFIAATYLRGVPFIQVPTSLLAQVDSSVGGKVAVNHPLGKNLIGTFYQPYMVIADTEMLASLPERELSTGLAEVIKHGIIADPAYFSYLEENSFAVAGRQQPTMCEIVQGSCKIKAQVVEQDEKEARLRMILNFGHTIGHAVEGNTGYSLYTHGEAVAIGMHGAALISQHMGLCSPETVEAIRSMLVRYKLPLKARQCNLEEMMAFLARDKKSYAGRINWVLIKAIGQVTIVDNVPEQVVRQVIGEIVEV